MAKEPEKPTTTIRFKELDLVDRVPEELWIEARNIVQEAATKTIPKKMKCKKAKCLSNEALEIAEKRRETNARETGKVTEKLKNSKKRGPS